MQFKIWKYLKLYISLFVQELKSKMSYPIDFLIALSAIVCTCGIVFFSFWVIFENFSSIGGFSYDEIMFLYGFFLVAITPAQIFFANNWNLANKIYTGDFLIYCTKPINVFFYFYSEVRDFNGFFQGIVGILVMRFSCTNLNLQWDITTFFMLAIGLVSASLVFISIMNVAASILFIVINGDYLLEIVNKIKDYAKYPISIYNTFFTILFSIIIPIGYVSFYPSMIILRRNTLNFFCSISPIIGGVMFFISYKIWMCISRKYIGTGS